ncbi:MAG: DUF4445 domain-containing protein [Verrucomicrobia bacterium]|nr:DUF4445 domain-containing protein [Verrucomicrobiota bacterium]
MSTYTVEFVSQNKTVRVEEGASLLEAAAKADIVIGNLCGGDGVCGRCKMIVKEGRIHGNGTMLLTLDEIRDGYVLACQSRIQGDLKVEIPAQTLAGDRVEVDQDAQRFRALNPGISRRPFANAPLVSKVFVKLSEPTLEDNEADCQRVLQALARASGDNTLQMGLRIMRQLPALLRENNFAVTALLGARGHTTEVMDIEGGDSSARQFIAVVDVGTTTVVAHLVNVPQRATVDAEACFNAQAVYGCEVTARIMASERRSPIALQEMIVGNINRLIATVAARSHVNLTDITAVVCAGNSAMTHFLLGLPASHIRRKPYIAASLEPPPLRAAEVGLRIHPRGLLYCVPGIGSWVGGDITAGILATGLYERDEITMLIDVGTNGEIVLGNKDWMMACSASTGPALEGASVACGMMGETGAIERVFIEDGQIHYRVIGNAAPKGICGSGIIDLVAVLLDKGIIDRAGKFVAGSDPAVSFQEGRGSFMLVSKAQGAVRDIFIRQDDLENIITAKAAIFAATKILLERLNLGFPDIKRLFLAGGFGNFIDRQNAVKIGLLPDLPLSRIQYVGNTSITGAKLAALSREACETLSEIRKRTTYYDLLGSADYVEQFKQAMFLPHTNIELFPSSQQHAGEAA